MQIANKKILVTGGAGFIGSHLVEKLVKLGASVRIFEKTNELKNFSREIIEQIEIFIGDLRNKDEVKKAAEGVDIVFHLAGLISVKDSYEMPTEYFQTNSIGTLNILEVCKGRGVEKIILISSSEVYGNPGVAPVSEEIRLKALSPYAASKICAEKIAEAYYNSYEMPVITLRLFNVYGPRQSTKAVIPSLISDAISTGSVKLGSPNIKRDFLYIADVVAVFIKIAESDNCNGEVINIGSGNLVSLGEVVNLIEKNLDKKISVESRFGEEGKKIVCDNSKIKRLIGWEPVISLNEGLKKTIDFFGMENAK